MPRQFNGPAPLLVTAILLAALFHAQSVRAEARISGEPDAVWVEARDASVDEVMAALVASFDLRYRSPASLTRRVTGTYEGSLQQVVGRLLDGYNFVLRTGSEGVEAWVYGAVGAGGVLLTPRAVEVAKPAPAVRARRDARRKRQVL
jgi:hypothetical protein